MYEDYKGTLGVPYQDDVRTAAGLAAHASDVALKLFSAQAVKGVHDGRRL